ncbi:MAG: hypothetical protein GY796_36435, partial [Chloroflexi bacterium]|nr:hypothetical protein [Chloroflexota bacterium]
MHNTTQFWLILLITIISIGCQSTSEGDLSTRAVLSDTARTTIEITRPVTETAVSPTPNHPTPPPPLVTPPLTANIPTSLFYIDEN